MLNNIKISFKPGGGVKIVLPFTLSAPAPVKLICPADFSDPRKIGMFDYNIVTGRNTWSKELREIYGYTEDEYKEVITDWSSMIHPDDVKKVQNALQNSFQTGIYKTSFRVILPHTGEIKLIQACGQVVYDSNGKPRVLSGINAVL
jgi:PAS domain-containing protein